MRSYLILSIVLLAGCSQPATPPSTAPTTPRVDLSEPPDGPKVRILFLGNSLTAGNDVPGLVKAMASAGGIPVFVHAETPGGVGLEDHWRNTQTRGMVRWGRWSHVVWQQGPSLRPESQADLKKWSETWGPEISLQGATPVFFMVWPMKSEPQMFPEVAKSYRTGAAAAKGKLAAAGEAWQELLKLDPTAELYSDDLHATPMGSYLAALVLVHRLTGVTPDKVPGKLTLDSGTVVEVPAEKLEAVRMAALKAIEGK